MNGKKERQIIQKCRSVHVHVQILAVKVQSSKDERRSRTQVTFSVYRTSLMFTHGDPSSRLRTTANWNGGKRSRIFRDRLIQYVPVTLANFDLVILAIILVAAIMAKKMDGRDELSLKILSLSWSELLHFRLDQAHEPTGLEQKIPLLKNTYIKIPHPAQKILIILK